ncbi:MAG: EAL domain-containing protein, partial [Acidobacteriota bacterium]
MNYSNGVTGSILIVDDDESIRNLLHSILSDGYICTLVESAEQALTCLENETFDLVISDINMGGMTGIELVSQVVVSWPDTVVMVISGNATIDSPIDAVRSGAFDYIKKPFNIDQVSIAVDRAIEHGKLLVSKRRHENELEQLVTERTEKLNYLAYHDSLTGLPNRSFFEDGLTKVLRSATVDDPVAVLMISLDRFQELRDTLGHSLGLQILKEAANRLNSLTDDRAMVARLDGDEFALFLPGTLRDELINFVDSVYNIFTPPIAMGEYEIYETVSLGISLSSDDGADPETMLKNAGAALSHARKQGGNNYQFYTADINEKAVRRLTMENDLHRALERNEFELYYQPKVEVNTRRIVGMEALIRWNHPDLGSIQPGDFISVAEETGLIVPMGEWILRTACAQSKLWRDKGFLVNVAVNLSPCQFQQKDLGEKIAHIVRETGLDATSLNLEVTESSIMNNTSAAIKILADLRKIGIKISIDDFGTGHSSLGYLKHLP